MFQDITVAEWLKLKKEQHCTVIDVRSPSEYADGTIPDSLNIPLFDDAERAEIGTLYKQSSAVDAKQRGLEIVSAKLPEYIQKIGSLPHSKVVFCWRGGMRSKTAATVLSLMGIKVYRLNGGVRAYRRWVSETLQDFSFKPYPIVIQGNTGTGKTELLLRLAAEDYPVLDLEGLAGHRGSIFGGIGKESRNQKTFESLLLARLLALQSSPYVLFEAESKRIGKVMVPDFLLDQKKAGSQIVIKLPMQERVKQILQDYKPWQHQEACLKAYERIKQRIHTPVAKQIQLHLEAEEYAPAVELLLQYYYDPRYAHSAKAYPDPPSHTIQAKHIDDACDQLKQCLQEGISTF